LKVGMSEGESFESHPTITVGNTLGPYRQCSDARDREWAKRVARALPIRLVPVSRLRLRQARDLWVFNRNELMTKGLPDGKSRDKSDVRLGV